MATEGDDPLVLLLSVPNEMLVHMWADKLKKSEIRSVVKPATFIATYGVGYSFNLQFELWVLSSQADKAREILSPTDKNADKKD